MSWEPFVDRGDVNGGFVADGQLVVAGGDGAVALEPADAALHGVACFVQLRVEGGRPSAGAALGLPVADLVGLLWDCAPDPASSQVRAVATRTVGLVGQHSPGTGPGPSQLGPGNPDGLQDDLELRAVAALARGGEDR
jgi:hypothetical protein